MLLSCRRIFCSPMFMRKGYLNRSTGVKGKHRPDLSLSSSPAARQADHSATKPESRFLWIFLAGMTVRQPFFRQKIKKLLIMATRAYPLHCFGSDRPVSCLPGVTLLARPGR
jgi:hypothetical protein